MESILIIGGMLFLLVCMMVGGRREHGPPHKFESPDEVVHYSNAMKWCDNLKEKVDPDYMGALGGQERIQTLMIEYDSEAVFESLYDKILSILTVEAEEEQAPPYRRLTMAESLILGLETLLREKANLSGTEFKAKALKLLDHKTEGLLKALTKPQ